MNQTTYEIHPAIGVARLGSSRDPTGDGVFHGPEPGVAPPEAYRDPAGDLKRQAARFRVFRCVRDAAHRILDAAEVTPRDARITWTVHLANRKGTARRITGRGFRNPWNGGDDLDRALIIDPGPRSVSTPGERQVFDTGRFRTTPVALGEIRMEPDGRLLVLGGYGRSGSDPPQARLDPLTGTAVDNRNWYDDS